jgi:predicted XRE-type DNA-binding protein
MNAKKRGRPVTAVMIARRNFIEKWVLSPEITIREIAEAVGVTQDWVIKVANRKGLLQQREANRLAVTKKMQSGLPKMLVDVDSPKQ